MSISRSTLWPYNYGLFFLQNKVRSLFIERTVLQLHYVTGGKYLWQERTLSFPDKAQFSGKFCDQINVTYHSKISKKDRWGCCLTIFGCCLWIQSADWSRWLGSGGHGALGTGHRTVPWAWLLHGHHHQPVRVLHFMGEDQCPHSLTNSMSFLFFGILQWRCFWNTHFL